MASTPNVLAEIVTHSDMALFLSRKNLSKFEAGIMSEIGA
jgi:hypothetical protein